MKCANCGTQLADGSRFCGACGAELTPQPQKQPETRTASPAPAPALVPDPAPTPAPDKKAGPFAVLGRAVRNWFASVRTSIRQPKVLIPAFVLAGIWVLLAVLRACGVDALPVRLLSFVSFGEGGLHGGVIGLVGGIIGKALLAWAVTALVVLLTRKKTGKKGGLSGRLSGIIGVSLGTLWPYLTGAGAAVFIFLLFSGGWTRTAFMAGAAAALLSARDALRGGLVTRLLRSFTKKGQTGASSVTAAVRGMTVGFAGSALLGLIDSSLVLIIIGGVLLVGGTVMTILQAKGVVRMGKEGVQ